MSGITFEGAEARLSLQGRAKRLDSIEVLDAFNFISGHIILIEDVRRTGLTVYTTVLDEPPGHWSNDHTTHESTSEPESWKNTVHTSSDSTDDGAGTRVVKEQRTIVVLLLMVTKVVKDQLIAQSE